jgi:hypothetical protein
VAVTKSVNAPTEHSDVIAGRRKGPLQDLAHLPGATGQHDSARLILRIHGLVSGIAFIPN